MNVKNAIQIICTKYVQNSQNPVQNLDNLCHSLDRYVTSIYEMSPESNNFHYEEFMAYYLLKNYQQLIDHGWFEKCHQVCNDTFNNEELFDPIIV
jgi:hypothetical protein